MKKFTFLLVTATLSWTTLTIGSDTIWRTYSLKGYPKTSQECAKTALEIGAKFTEVTGKPIYSAVSEKETKETCDILITYATPTPLPYVSTLNESGGLGYLGVYRTLKECENALPRETSTFSNATKLRLLISYCFKETDITLTPYVARIDAFGEAKLYPYRFEQSVFATSIEKTKEVLEALIESSKAAGLSVHHATFAHDGSLKLVIRFYGSPLEQGFHSEYFKLNEVATFTSLGTVNPLGTCHSELETLSKSFAESFTTPGVLFCSWDGLLFDSQLYLVRIRRNAGIQRDSMPPRYATFDACDHERPGVEAWYEKNLGVKPFSVLCTWSLGIATGKPDAYVIKVFTKVGINEEPPFWSDIL